MDDAPGEPAAGGATVATVAGRSSTAPGAEASGYQQRWEADVVLADGGTMLVRPIRPDDAERMVRFHERQSPESIYFRFFSPRPRLSTAEVERFTTIDYVDRMAFVGIIGDELVGVARYDRHRARSDAEVAFFIDDEHHGRGMATVLLEFLAVAAREAGISGFTASVLPQNRKMLGVFTQAGFRATSRFEEGIVEVELAIEPTPEALAAIEERAKVAEARSVERLLRPHSIAVIGASRVPGTIGHSVFSHLVGRGFQGPVYPVNTEATHVASVRAWPSVLDLPGELDLAVIAVPADDVRRVVEECAVKRVQGLVVISSGFADAGSRGAEREQELVSFARRHGMRMIGPNCLGVINTAPDVGLHATFADVQPLAGRLGISAQSGTIGAAIVEHARQVGLGISTFVAVGNKADVSGNDLLRYWEDDEGTDVVLLYLESFGNPRKFTRIARRFSQRKPIVAVKVGRREAGSAGSNRWVQPEGWPVDATAQAVLDQTGVVRVDTLTQMFHTAQVLLHQPLPRGRRVAIVSNSWGPAQLAADACRAAGLELAVLADATRVRVGEVLPGQEGVLDNGLDLPNDIGAADVGAALQAVLADDGVDAAMVLYAPPVTARTDEVARAVVDASERFPDRTVLACYLGGHQPLLSDGSGPTVPEYPFPEEAALALVRVARYAEWRRAPVGELPTFPDADPEAARSLVDRWLDGEPAGRWLDATEAAELLGTFGLEPVPALLADDAAAAVVAARALGYPVAVKATGLARLAKTEAGGVALDVHGDDEVRSAHRRMVERLGTAMRPTLIQAMVPPGVECLVGLHRHPVLGDVLTLGVGGAVAEQLEEVALRILPVTDVDAARLVDASRVGAVLDDAGPSARAALEERLLRLGALADAVPEIAQVRLNPILVSANRAAITDVRIRLERWIADPRPEVRSLG